MLRRQTTNPKIHAGVGILVVMLFVSVSLFMTGRVWSIAQAFQTDDSSIVTGALASLKSDPANTIELATVDNIDRLLGIVDEASLIELSGGVGTVQVVTGGEATALVSDINGAVKTGDKITASPIAGVGMKALTSTFIIGTAQADLDSVATKDLTLTDKSNKNKTVHVGAIQIQVDKVYYQPSQDTNAFLPPALQQFAATIAGRQVSPVRVMLAGMLVVLLFVIVGVLLYSAVRSSIISIGRNPLSERAVRKSLFQVGLVIAGVSAFTMAVIYLILTV